MFITFISLVGCVSVLAVAVGYSLRDRNNTRVRMVSIPALPPIGAVADELDTYEELPARLAA